MNIPKKLNLCGIEWTVEESQDVALQGNVYGSTHFSSQKIILRPDMSTDYEAETFLHEILHVCIDQSGLSERLERAKEHISEEEIVKAISTQLYQAIKENKLRFDE